MLDVVTVTDMLVDDAAIAMLDVATMNDVIAQSV